MSIALVYTRTRDYELELFRREYEGSARLHVGYDSRVALTWSVAPVDWPPMDAFGRLALCVIGDAAGVSAELLRAINGVAGTMATAAAVAAGTAATVTLPGPGYFVSSEPVNPQQRGARSPASRRRRRRRRCAGGAENEEAEFNGLLCSSFGHRYRRA